MNQTFVKSKTWSCEKCNALLGFIDFPDLARIKYKDLYVMVDALQGSTLVKVLCRRCGFENSIKLQVKKLS